MQPKDFWWVRDLWRENGNHWPWHNWKTKPHEIHLQTELDLWAGKLVQINEKFTSEKVRTFSDGGTP